LEKAKITQRTQRFAEKAKVKDYTEVTEDAEFTEKSRGERPKSTVNCDCGTEDKEKRGKADPSRCSG